MKLSRNKIIKLKKKKHQSLKNNKKKYNKINKKKRKKTFSKKNKKRNFNVRYNTVKKKRKKTHGGIGKMRNFFSKSKDQPKEELLIKKDSANIIDNFMQINDLIKKFMNIKLETDVNSITKSPTQMHVSYYNQRDYEDEYKSIITRDKIFFDPINGRIFFTETYLYFNFYNTGANEDNDIVSRLNRLLSFQSKDINTRQKYDLLRIIYPKKVEMDIMSRIERAKSDNKRKSKLASNRSRLSSMDVINVGNKRLRGGAEDGDEDYEFDEEEEKDDTDLVGKRDRSNWYGMKKGKAQKEAEAKALQKYREKQEQDDDGDDDIDYKTIAKLITEDKKKQKKECKKPENKGPGGCCIYDPGSCLPFKFARMIAMKNVLKLGNEKSRKAFENKKQNIKNPINKEKIRDVVAASSDKQEFLQRCRELIEKEEKNTGFFVRKRTLNSLKKIIKKNFKTDDEKLVKEILVHYLINTPFVDEKIISIKLSPYTFAVTKENKGNITDYNFNTKVLNTNTINNNQIEDGEVNEDEIKNVNVNLMYTDFTHQNEFLKDNEQIKSEDIEYENKILSDQVDFDKKFAKKTLDGSKAAIIGGKKGKPPRSDDDDNFGDGDTFLDEGYEEDFEDNLIGDDLPLHQQEEEQYMGEEQDTGEKPPQEEQPQQVVTIDNNPILEKIKKKLGKLEFSLRSTINPEIKDKYFDVGDTEKDMSFVKTKKNISIFVEYKKISTDGGAADNGAPTEVVTPPENQVTSEIVDGNAEEGSVESENAEQDESAEQDETADAKKTNTEINKNDWQKGVIIGLTGTSTFKIKNLQTNETIDINVDEEEYETNLYYPFTGWFFPYINFGDASIKFSVATLKRYFTYKFYAQKSKKEIEESKSTPETLLANSNHWFNPFHFGKELLSGPEYVEADTLKLANIPRQIPMFINDNETSSVINMLTRHDKKEYQTLLEDNPIDADFKKFIKNYVKAIDNQVSKVGKDFSNDAAIKELMELKNVYKKCGQEVCGEEDIKKLAVLANQLRNKVVNKVIDLNNNDIKIIYICDLRGRIYKLSQVKKIRKEDIEKYDGAKNIIHKKLNELVDNGADQTTQDGDFLLDIKKEYRIILENFQKTNPDEYKALGEGEYKISIDELNKTIKRDTYDNSKLKQKQDRQIEAKKLKKSLNDIHKDGKGDMDVVRKSLEVFLESALRKTNLSRGSTFSQSLINLTSFLSRSGKECDKMWKEYKKIYNSKDKGKEELTRLKDEFLRENKEHIFKCVETNRMGDIFHLLDNHYDYVRDSVYKSKNEQKDLEEAKKKAEEAQAKLAEAEAAEAKAKAEGNAAELAEAKKSAEDAKKLAIEAKKSADIAQNSANEITSQVVNLKEFNFIIPENNKNDESQVNNENDESSEQEKREILEYIIENETDDNKRILQLMEPIEPDEDEEGERSDEYEEGGSGNEDEELEMMGGATKEPTRFGDVGGEVSDPMDEAKTRLALEKSESEALGEENPHDEEEDPDEEEEDPDEEDEEDDEKVKKAQKAYIFYEKDYRYDSETLPNEVMPGDQLIKINGENIDNINKIKEMKKQTEKIVLTFKRTKDSKFYYEFREEGEEEEDDDEEEEDDEEEDSDDEELNYKVKDIVEKMLGEKDGKLTKEQIKQMIDDSKKSDTEEFKPNDLVDNIDSVVTLETLLSLIEKIPFHILKQALKVEIIEYAKKDAKRGSEVIHDEAKRMKRWEDQAIKKNMDLVSQHAESPFGGGGTLNPDVLDNKKEDLKSQEGYEEYYELLYEKYSHNDVLNDSANNYADTLFKSIKKDQESLVIEIDIKRDFPESIHEIKQLFPTKNNLLGLNQIGSEKDKRKNEALYKFINYKLELNDYIIKNIKKKPKSDDVIQVEIKSKKEEEEENKAAVKIQSMGRSKTAKNIVSKKKEEKDKKEVIEQSIDLVKKFGEDEAIIEANRVKDGEKHHDKLQERLRTRKKKNQNSKSTGGKKTKKRKNYKQKNKSQKKN